MAAWRSKLPLRLDTLLLVFVAGLVLVTTRARFSATPMLTTIQGCAEVVATAVLAFLMLRRAKTEFHAQALVAIAVGVAAIYPLVADLLLRQVMIEREPFELLMLTSLQLVTVVLALFCQLPRLGSTAVLLSSFLLLFVTSMTGDAFTLTLTGIFAALALWWLMGAYWDRLEGTFVASSIKQQAPMRLPVVAGTVLVLLIPAGLIATSGTAVALPGFLPTSGGTQWYDPNARQGIGDGDAMVAAQDQASSFGPVESELFLESDMPTLYDMLNEVYGDPPKPKKKKTERTVALSQDFSKILGHQKTAKSERSGREFSVVRRKTEQKRKQVDDLLAPAMFYVVGRVPVHLALERFDTFDGREWTHSPGDESKLDIVIKEQDGRPWAYFGRMGYSVVHRGVETHAVKIINLKSDRFPAPPQLTAVHIDKVDMPDFYGWTSDGMACMPVRKHVPQLSVVHLKSQGVNLEPLRDSSAGLQFHKNAKLNRDPDHSETLAEWTQDLPSGWQQVEAVVGRLRSDYTLDPNATPPEDCPDIVAHFIETKRGPAYLFATTAATLLRKAGYETRLVTGFYARDDRYDRRAGQTSVSADDVHVWAEVRIDERTWVAIEPTPGYEPPRESLTWKQRATIALTACIGWVWRHILAIMAFAALALLLFFTRHTWLDATAVAFCRAMGSRSPRSRLLWTIRLLEWRAWLTGSSRPRQTTVAKWYAPLFEAAPSGMQGELSNFLQWTDRLLYAPAGIDRGEPSAIHRSCQSVVAACTRKLLATNLSDISDGNRRQQIS